MLARVEDSTTLANEDVTGNHEFVCFVPALAPCVHARVAWDVPENFFTPNRFPGDPPWLETVPPARFVAVRTEPKPNGIRTRSAVNSIVCRSHGYCQRTCGLEWVSEEFCTTPKALEGHGARLLSGRGDDKDKRQDGPAAGTVKTLGLYKPISKSYLDAISHRRRFDYSLHQTTIVRPYSLPYYTSHHGSSCHFR